MRWTATEKDGQQEGHFCRGEPPKGRQTWAGSHCPRQRLEASLPIPTSIISAESPSARPGNAKEISGGGGQHHGSWASPFVMRMQGARER
jgi:hypothetical protein